MWIIDDGTGASFNGKSPTCERTFSSTYDTKFFTSCEFFLQLSVKLFQLLTME